MLCWSKWHRDGISASRWAGMVPNTHIISPETHSNPTRSVWLFSLLYRRGNEGAEKYKQLTHIYTDRRQQSGRVTRPTLAWPIALPLSQPLGQVCGWPTRLGNWLQVSCQGQSSPSGSSALRNLWTIQLNNNPSKEHLLLVSKSALQEERSSSLFLTEPHIWVFLSLLCNKACLSCMEVGWVVSCVGFTYGFRGPFRVVQNSSTCIKVDTVF